MPAICVEEGTLGYQAFLHEASHAIDGATLRTARMPSDLSVRKARRTHAPFRPFVDQSQNERLTVVEFFDTCSAHRLTAFLDWSSKPSPAIRALKARSASPCGANERPGMRVHARMEQRARFLRAGSRKPAACVCSGRFPLLFLYALKERRWRRRELRQRRKRTPPRMDADSPALLKDLRLESPPPGKVFNGREEMRRRPCGRSTRKRVHLRFLLASDHGVGDSPSRRQTPGTLSPSIIDLTCSPVKVINTPPVPIFSQHEGRPLEGRGPGFERVATNRAKTARAFRQ